MAPHDDLIYGERLDDLVPAIESFYEFLVSRFSGDMRKLAREFDLPSLRPELAPPFRRALLRAQAEVLVEYAALLGDDGCADGIDAEFEGFRRIAAIVGYRLQRTERRADPASVSSPPERRLVLVRS